MTGIPDSDIVAAIYQLLPGFVTAWIFYGLTAHPKTSPFERVIQALIFTLFVETIVQAIGLSAMGLGKLSFIGAHPKGRDRNRNGLRFCILRQYQRPSCSPSGLDYQENFLSIGVVQCIQ